MTDRFPGKLDRIRRELLLAESKLKAHPYRQSAIDDVARLTKLLAEQEALALKRHFGPKNAE
ncbi:MAG TPA: hypothetical protein VJX71_09825 [Methylomirabilota bacterium]|nr:hypothetical protein [Methylomirabilota bacterium]